MPCLLGSTIDQTKNHGAASESRNEHYAAQPFYFDEIGNLSANNNILNCKERFNINVRA